MLLPVQVFADVDAKVLVAVNNVQAWSCSLYEVFFLRLLLVQTLMTVHFSGWKRFCHLISQSSRAVRSVWRSTESLSFLMCRYRRQSSANSIASEVFTTSGRSLMKARNSSGPKTVPWGTPESTSFWEDFWPSKTTCWDRPLRNRPLISTGGLRRIPEWPISTGCSEDFRRKTVCWRLSPVPVSY